LPVIAALAAACLTNSVFAAEPPFDAALAQAMGDLRAGRFAQVAKRLTPRMKRLADNALAWRTLAMADLRQHHSRAAIAGYARVLALDPANPTALFYRGIAHAQLGQLDQAFEWLGQARATRRFDMSQLADEPDTAALAKDARYAALLPAQEDFDHPFVEKVRILREWRGEAAGDQFGWIARMIGDTDGDGVDDFVTSAPDRANGGAKAGRVYVYSGKDGHLLWQFDGHAGDELGSGIEAGGDIDGDGIPAVLASAPKLDTLYALSGKDGHVLLTLHGKPHENFGQHVASLGDIEGNGHAAIVVGAPGESPQASGHCYIYSGKDGHLLLDLAGDRAGDQFGSTVAAYHDARHSFVVVGAAAAGPLHHGRVYVYNQLSTRPRFILDAGPTGRALGYMFVGVSPDVDGDGVPDIYASDWADAALGPFTGRVLLYSGRDGHLIRQFTGQTQGEGFGTSHSIAGDIDGDGHADLIVGAWQYGGAAVGGGRAYLYDGFGGKLLRTYTARVAGETFGFDAVATGARDDQGQPTLLVTSGWSAANGHHAGRIFLISSGIDRASVATQDVEHRPALQFDNFPPDGHGEAARAGRQ
jgi:hypothetical protein